MRRALLILLLLCCRMAGADGPHIALHAAAGGYTATLFTAPDPLVTGKVEFALLLQQGEGGPVAAVRTARVVLRPSEGQSLEAALTPGANGSRELLGGLTAVPRAGEYGLEIAIVDARGTAVRFPGTLSVAQNHGRALVVLLGAALPLAIVALFLVNQAAKQKLRGPRSPFRSEMGTRAK